MAGGLSSWRRGATSGSRGAGARFGCLERRWGVPLIDGGTIRLPRIVGLGRALDLILTGREFDVEEAERIGFVNRVVPTGGARAGRRDGQRDRRVPWNAVLHDRASVYEGLGLGMVEALANEDVHGRQVIFDPGFQAGVDRFVENQRAASTGRRPALNPADGDALARRKPSTASTAAAPATC